MKHLLIIIAIIAVATVVFYISQSRAIKPDFSADDIDLGPEEEYWVVWLSDGTRYLTFQRAKEFDQQDISLGMDGIYVERDSQRYSGYHCIESIELSTSSLTVRFNPDRQRSVGGISEMTVAFDLPAERLSSLRIELERCCEGFPIFRDNT